MELIAIILWVLAAVLLTASFDMLRGVNPNSRLPFFFGSPPNNPPAGLRGAAPGLHLLPGERMDIQ